jgi:hypothetical protein
MVVKSDMMGGREPEEGSVGDRACRKLGGGVRLRSVLRMMTTVTPAMPRFFCAPPWELY